MAGLPLLTYVKTGLRDWLWPLFAQWFVFLTAIISKLLGGLEAHPAVQFPKQCLEERCGLAVSLPCVRLVARVGLRSRTLQLLGQSADFRQPLFRRKPLAAPPLLVSPDNRLSQAAEDDDLFLLVRTSTSARRVVSSTLTWPLFLAASPPRALITISGDVGG